jgi:cysteinyl-tRNA synthetase
MNQDLNIYNTLSRKKEKFVPLHPPFAGIYACGPTVYGEPHLGHARQAVTFDIIYRYLLHLGYKVRYVRNITDVGHLEHDADEGEDKIARKARLEKLEPMEIVQKYTNEYRDKMRMLHILPPSIEPVASGHIIEQQEMVARILEKGFAYEVNGSVYFDVDKYHSIYGYGRLSGRKIEDLLSHTRPLNKQDEKRNPLDFAIWKRAEPGHIMRWPSAWSDGFPGWHLECSVMSVKYLGDTFDIHGGGMDLLFPHHDCEIAQNVAVSGKESVKYWMHNNLVTINGQKMSKSLGNSISLDQCFTGAHDLLQRSYTPMTVRFFMLQAHYRSTLDFSNEALQAAEKGLERLFDGMENLKKIKPSVSSSFLPSGIEERFYEAMNDDLNTPVAISVLFEGIKNINAAVAGTEKLTREDIEQTYQLYQSVTEKVLGLKKEVDPCANNELIPGLVELLLSMRNDARDRKDFKTADKIRDELARLRVSVKDTKDGNEWSIDSTR